jgi:hypothetical protein
LIAYLSIKTFDEELRRELMRLAIRLRIVFWNQGSPLEKGCIGYCTLEGLVELS